MCNTVETTVTGPGHSFNNMNGNRPDMCPFSFLCPGRISIHFNWSLGPVCGALATFSVSFQSPKPNRNVHLRVSQKIFYRWTFLLGFRDCSWDRGTHVIDIDDPIFLVKNCWSSLSMRVCVASTSQSNSNRFARSERNISGESITHLMRVMTPPVIPASSPSRIGSSNFQLRGLMPSIWCVTTVIGRGITAPVTAP